MITEKVSRLGEYWPETPDVVFKGWESADPLSFKVYDPTEIVNEQTMEENLRFAFAFWHGFNPNLDMFGSGTMEKIWSSEPLENAIHKIYAGFEFMPKLKLPFYCFHDDDVLPPTTSLRERKNMTEIILGVMLS